MPPAGPNNSKKQIDPSKGDASADLLKAGSSGDLEHGGPHASSIMQRGGGGKREALTAALKGDLSDAEARAKTARGDVTQTWGLFLGFKAFCLSFTATATKMGCGDWWAPVTLLTAGFLVGSPAMFMAVNEHDKQGRRIKACRKQLKSLHGTDGGASPDAALLPPAGGENSQDGDASWQLGSEAGGGSGGAAAHVASSAGGHKVKRRRWPGAVAVAAMSIVYAAIFTAINKILCV